MGLHDENASILLDREESINPADPTEKRFLEE